MTKQVICSKNRWPNNRVFPWESGNGMVDFYTRCKDNITFIKYAKNCPYYCIEDDDKFRYKTCCNCFNCQRVKGD